MNRIERELGIRRWLVWIVDPGKAFDLAFTRERVHALRIAILAYLERRIDKDLAKTIAANHRATLIARRTVRTDRGANHCATVSHNFRGDETDATNVRLAIFFAEAESFREMRTNHVAIEHGDLPSMLEQHDRQDVSRS